MKRSVIFCFTIFLIIISCKKEEIVDIIIDGDVENISEKAWWRIPLPPFSRDFTISRTREEYASPAHSLKISKIVKGSYAGAFFQEIDSHLLIGQDIILTAKIKCVDLDGPGAAIALSCDCDSPDNPYPVQFATQEFKINGTTNWKDYSVMLNNLNSEVKRITVYLIYLPNTSGKVYFDDIRLEYTSL